MEPIAKHAPNTTDINLAAGKEISHPASNPEILYHGWVKTCYCFEWACTPSSDVSQMGFNIDMRAFLSCFGIINIVK
jgi:hypothetical protein